MSYFNDATGEWERPLPRFSYSEETGETYSEPDAVPCYECGMDTEAYDIGQIVEQGRIYCESCWLDLPMCDRCEAAILDEPPVTLHLRNERTGKIDTERFHAKPCFEDAMAEEYEDSGDIQAWLAKAEALVDAAMERRA